MKKTAKKFILLLLLVLSLSFVFACDEGNFPSFINPDGGGDSSVGGADKYIIKVESAGGMPLSGVRVNAKKDGVTVKSGISQKGEIVLSMPLDEYTLEFSDLPAGYFVEEGKTYVTSKDSYDFTASFPSKVIEQTGTSSTSYKIGDVMHNFRITDCDGQVQDLSALVAANKAVVLNFWYRSCGPCRSEFPSLERAYKLFSNKLAILALSNQDYNEQIKSFKTSGVQVNNEDFPLTFSMGFDNAGVTQMFGVMSFPTTVIVDRYGVVAYVHSGSITNDNDWLELFETYTSDDYVQTPVEEEGGENDEQERVLPTVENESAQDLYSALAGAQFGATNPTFGNDPDDEYSWPFTIQADGKSVISSNTGVHNSYSQLYLDFDVKYNDRLQFDYSVSSETDMDILYIVLNGQIVDALSGDRSGTYDKLTFNQTERVNLVLIYLKDAGASDGDDCVTLSNFRITTVEDVTGTVDVRRDAVTQINADKTDFINKKDYFVGEDGYYYVYNEKNVATLLYADLHSPTQWTRLRFGNQLQELNDPVAGGSYARSVWLITFWQLCGQSDKNIVLNGNNYTDYIIEQYNMQGWITYLPVDAKLATMLNDFAWEYYNQKGGQIPNDSTWMEFCSYFDHYGDEHGENEDCFVTDNLALGMTLRSAILMENLVGKNDIKVGDVVAQGEANNRYEIQVERGVRYKFVAPATGVYGIRSTETSIAKDAYILLYNEDGEYLTENDNNFEYDRFTANADGVQKYYNNACVYVYLEEGEACYPVFAMSFPGDTGVYSYEVTYEATESLNKIYICSTGEGTFTYDEVTGADIYLAIPITSKRTGAGATGTTYYHSLNGKAAGKIYIDFVHPNLLDNNGNTLYDMIYTIGAFDFSYFSASDLENSGLSTAKDYTTVMMEYYQKSIEGKDESDPYYGLIEANGEIVSILNGLIWATEWKAHWTVDAWRAFAVYDKTISVEVRA